MKEYIERDIWKSLPDDLPYKASVKRVLMQAPAADVKPVARGEWHEFEYGKCLCSECGQVYSKEFAAVVSYCAKCGAEMVMDCHQLEENES